MKSFSVVLQRGHFQFDAFLTKSFVFKATIYFEICLHFYHKTNTIGVSQAKNQQP